MDRCRRRHHLWRVNLGETELIRIVARQLPATKKLDRLTMRMNGTCTTHLLAFSANPYKSQTCY